MKRLILRLRIRIAIKLQQWALEDAKRDRPLRSDSDIMRYIMANSLRVQSMVEEYKRMAA